MGLIITKSSYYDNNRTQNGVQSNTVNIMYNHKDPKMLSKFLKPSLAHNYTITIAMRKGKRNKVMSTYYSIEASLKLEH